MSELLARVEEAREHLRAPQWSAQRADRVLSQIQHRRRRSTLSTVALGSAALAVAVVVALIWFAQGGPQEPSPQLATNWIELQDGTRAVELGQLSHVRLLDESDSQVSFSLDTGKGWFEVKPTSKRRVEVHIQDVRVVVSGTEFVVEVENELVQIWVRRGSVKVHSAGTSVVLGEGEQGRFPAHDPEPVSTPPSQGAEQSPEAPVEAPAAKATRTSPGPSSQSAPAKPSLDPPTELYPPHEPPPAPTQDELIAALWKSADSARIAGRHAEAISALTELLAKHPDDPRAALAAFTLGRELIDSGKSSVTAARAFAKARKLAPRGPLVEDALLREIEAWQDAGDDRRVVSRCDKYLRLFPSGRYRKHVEEMRSLR